MHRYWVSYATPGLAGIETTEVSLQEPARSHADVQVMERLLREAGHRVAVLIAFSKFEDPQ